MKHLSALDAVFLHLETPETPMHVGSLMLLDKPPGKKKPYAAIRDHIARRLHLAPVFSRKLALMPMDLANPVWLHEDHVDLDHHIRALRLPAPGTDVQLDDAVAKLHEGMLDRSRPLWQFTVIDGLKSGQVGFYAKIHHAALDGRAASRWRRRCSTSRRDPRVVRDILGPRLHGGDKRRRGDTRRCACWARRCAIPSRRSGGS